ncbi:MAG: hypothetical protein ACYDH9_25180 [Limisphaerales bacterium]
METSLANFRERYRELALDFLWRQWSAIGVASHARTDDSWIIDPEALLLATTTFGRYEPRLFDEVLDWLNTNGQTVNLQRLQNLCQQFGNRGVLNGIAAHLAKRTANIKWRTLFREAKEATTTEPLFPDLPVLGEPDETFAHHGWRRGPVKLRQLSQPADPHQPTNLLFKLRALFGLQARAEVMAFLLAVESGHPGEMAQRIAYFPRTVQTTLNDMERSGHVLTRRDGREKRFWLRRDEWRFLITWSGRAGGTADFPRWVDWAPLFAALEEVWTFLTKPGLDGASPAVQAIELRACLDKLSPAFMREHLKTPHGAKGGDYVQSVLNDFCTILK